MAIQTKTAERQTMQPQAQTPPVQSLAMTGNDMVLFPELRLPYHNALNDEFGIDIAAWKTLTDVIFPSAKTVRSVITALSYCKSRNLDPLKRCIHIVPVWNIQANDGRGGYVDTIWPGISELRTTAFRTGQYVGSDEAEFGPLIEAEFTGRMKDWKEEKRVKVKFPEWCRITVHRIAGGVTCKFVGPKVYWLETYATIGNTDLPNQMWTDRAIGQIEKCAEAAALRRAFPEELGNELADDEIRNRQPIDVTPPRRPPPPDDEQKEAIAAAQIEHVQRQDAATVPFQGIGPATGASIRGMQAAAVAATSDQAASKPAIDTTPNRNGVPKFLERQAAPSTAAASPPAPEDIDGYRSYVDKKFSECSEIDALGNTHDRYVEVVKNKLLPTQIFEFGEMYGRHQRRIEDAY